MTTVAASPSAFQRRQVAVDNILIHVVEHGDPARPATLFLHGWPQDWSAFERVMLAMGEGRHLVAIDLPGIGLSEGGLPTSDKRTIARCVRQLVDVLHLREVTLVGHDVGAQIVFAYLHLFADDVSRAVLMNAAVPGIDPWSQVMRSPKAWHVGFHAVPELPDLLVAGHQQRYFDHFFTGQSARRDGVSAAARAHYAKAYERPLALHTGFEWHRSFEQDERDNVQVRDHKVDTPVLYLRGQRETGLVDDYLKGLRAAGLQNVRGSLISDAGHFAPDEQPAAVAEAIGRFIGALPAAAAREWPAGVPHRAAR
ncbi:MAG TPA: alpha/beta hydrolase [Burkholderiaceae bacterium]